jgi:predicted NBD/HSP70 family sugar kinase
MNHYVGIDVSLEASSVCVVDGNGKIVREGKIVSEPDALIAWLGGLKLELTRIGLICCGQIYVVSTEASQGLGISLGSLRNINRRTFRPTALSGRPSTTAESVVDMAGSCR